MNFEEEQDLEESKAKLRQQMGVMKTVLAGYPLPMCACACGSVINCVSAICSYSRGHELLAFMELLSCWCLYRYLVKLREDREYWLALLYHSQRMLVKGEDFDWHHSQRSEIIKRMKYASK